MGSPVRQIAKHHGGQPAVFATYAFAWDPSTRAATRHACAVGERLICARTAGVIVFTKLYAPEIYFYVCLCFIEL